MHTTLPETTREKLCKGALNGTANPSERLIDGDQFTLGSTEEKCREGANRLALLAREAMRDNGFSLSTLGSMIGKDATAAHRVLDAEDPSIALRVLAALLLLDKTATWLGGTARLTGRDLVERPAMTDAEFRRRVESKARHGKADAAWLEEAMEEKP
jgi:hypothetical protein